MKRLFRILLLLLFLLLTAAVLLTVSHKSLYRHTEQGSKSLTVLSYNTQRIGGFAKTENNKVVKYLQQCEADILCLQEVEVYKSDRYLTWAELRKALKHYPYYYCDFKIDNRRRQYGNVVFSRYPLTNPAKIGLDSRGNISSQCDVTVGKDTIRLFVNHLESNRLEQNDIDSVIQNRSLSHGRLMDKLHTAGRLRRAQARDIHRRIGKSPYPVIVTGDFNAIPLSVTYLTMRLGLRDCFLCTSNLRVGNTLVWRGRNSGGDTKNGRTSVLPKLGIRIDYILCSPCFVPVSFRTDRTYGSDHYPVISTITW